MTIEYPTASPENSTPIKIKPWYRLEAMGKYENGNIFYRPKEVRRLESPNLITTACLPGASVWQGGQLSRFIPEDGNCDFLLEKIDALKWVKGTFPTSKLTVYLTDDDFKYCYVDGYNPNLIEKHRLKLTSELEGELGNVEVKKISTLVDSVGLDYETIQAEILSKLEDTEHFFQWPGWIKAIKSSVDATILKKQNSSNLQLDKDAILKVSKVLIGVAIQGMALRKLQEQSHMGTLYLGTYLGLDTFTNFDTKVMMESGLQSLGNIGKPIPSVFCPSGDLDYNVLEQITKEISNENNPQVSSLGKNSFAAFSHERVKIARSERGKKLKACDDI